MARQGCDKGCDCNHHLVFFHLPPSFSTLKTAKKKDEGSPRRSTESSYDGCNHSHNNSRSRFGNFLKGAVIASNNCCDVIMPPL